MSAATLAGYPLVSAVLLLPFSGRWRGTFVVDADEIPTGTVELVLLGTAYTGTVVRGGSVGGEVTLRVVGGSGGYLDELAPKNWLNGVTVGALLRETLGQVKEGLASSSDPSLTGLLLPRWTRPRGPANEECARIVGKVDGTLRQLPDGTFCLCKDTWTEVSPSYELIDVIPTEQRAVISAEEIDVRPGQVLIEHGFRVVEVEHRVTPGTSLTHLLYEEAD